MVRELGDGVRGAHNCVGGIDSCLDQVNNHRLRRLGLTSTLNVTSYLQEAVDCPFRALDAVESGGIDPTMAMTPSVHPALRALPFLASHGITFGSSGCFP